MLPLKGRVSTLAIMDNTTHIKMNAFISEVSFISSLEANFYFIAVLPICYTCKLEPCKHALVFVFTSLVWIL